MILNAAVGLQDWDRRCDVQWVPPSDLNQRLPSTPVESAKAAVTVAKPATAFANSNRTVTETPLWSTYDSMPAKCTTAPTETDTAPEAEAASLTGSLNTSIHSATVQQKLEAEQLAMERRQQRLEALREVLKTPILSSQYL